MILYHTSDREIRKPDIHHGRKNADFGWGFYLTPDRDFIYRWARDNAVVNEYELDEIGLEIHSFSILHNDLRESHRLHKRFIAETRQPRDKGRREDQ